MKTKLLAAVLLFTGALFAQSKPSTVLSQGAVQGSPVKYCGFTGGVPVLCPGSGGGSVTVLIAASDSPQKANATVVCSGTNDQTCINNAITTYCPNSQTGVAGCDVVLQDGVYSTAGSVVIDNDDVTLRGMHHCMWGGFFHSWWTSPSSPVGAIGTGCAQIRASTSGFNLLELENHNPGGTGGDTSRHRGIDIHWVYFVGFNYNNEAIHMPNGDDFVKINDNVIQRVNNGIDVSLDSPTIAENSIQDISGNAITVAGIYARVRGNLIYDNGGSGINDLSTGSIVSLNVIGDQSGSGVLMGNADQSITGNKIGPVLGSYVIATLGTASGSISNNLFIQSGQTNTNENPVIGTNGVSISNISVTGNMFDSGGVIQPGAAIDLSRATGAAVSGNTGSGIWYGGAGSIQTTAAASSAGNYFTSPTLNPPVAANSVVIAGRWQASQISGVSSGSPITTWPDSSGFNRPLTILSGTGPLYEATSHVNSGPGVRFNGTNQALGIPTFALANNSSPKTVFMVFTLSSLASAVGPIAMINPDTLLYPANNAGYINSTGNTVCQFTTVVACGTVTAGVVNTTYIVEWLWNGASSRVAVNGTSNTVTSAVTDWSQGLVVGAQGTVNGQWFPGDLAEIDLYNGAATTGDAALIGAALCATYGVTCGVSW